MTALPSATGNVTRYPRPDLLWVTNLATPYRAPLWAELGRRSRLTVALLAEDEPNRGWQVPLDESLYEVIHLHALAVARTSDTTFYAPSLRLLRAVARRPGAVLMDGWESPAYLTAMALGRSLGIPMYASYRSTVGTHRFHGGPVAAVRGRFMRGARGVLTAGAESSAAVRHLGVPTSRIVQGFNTVDISRFAEGAARGRAGRSAVRAGGHRFLYVGQFIERKNVSGLLQAFAAMRAPQDTLTLVGTGPLEAQLRREASDLGVGEPVRFTGRLEGEALIAAYAAADTLVLPSLAEVWGLVVNEGLAAGLHAVVSDRCGVAVEIKDMPGVFIDDPGPAGMTRALAASRAAWTGPVADPPVLRHTPAALAEAVLGMIGLASSTADATAPGRPAPDGA